MNFKIIEKQYPNEINSLGSSVEEWPVTYLIHNKTKIYVGETTNAKNRLKDHANSESKQQHNFRTCQIIYSDHFNKSAIYLIETMLMRLIAADKKMQLVNTKTNQFAHDFYNKKEYENIVPKIWKQLKNKGIVKSTYTEVINSDIFKYSPFTSFTEEQLYVIETVLAKIAPNHKTIEINTTETDAFDNLKPLDAEHIGNRGNKNIDNKKFFAIDGKPGTGKSLLIVKMIFELVKNSGVDPKDICVMHNVDCSKSVLSKVLKQLKIQGVKFLTTMKLFNEDNNYKYIFVDEGQRTLKYSSKQANFTYKLREAGVDGLDVILSKGKNIVYMYDEHQSTRCSDVDLTRLFELEEDDNIEFYRESLNTVLRVSEEWDNFVFNVLNNRTPKFKNFDNYDVKIFNTMKSLHSAIKDQDKKVGLSRVVSGFSRKWEKNKPDVYEFSEKGYKAKWNSKTKGWFDSPNSINEIGSVFTIAGIDLNYCGVIIGKDIYYDKKDKLIKCNIDNFCDDKAKPPLDVDPEIRNKEICKSIINSYYILLTRGIKGTYLYIEDEALREYIKNLLKL